MNDTTLEKFKNPKTIAHLNVILLLHVKLFVFPSSEACIVLLIA